MANGWYKNYKYCQICKKDDKPYFAKGMCKKCYTRKNWENWTKKKTRGIFINCTICSKKWQAKRPITKRYNPKLCHSCSGRKGSQRKKQIHQAVIENKFGKPLKNLLKELYHTKGLAGTEVANYVGITFDQFYRWGHESGIKFRNPLFQKGNQLFKGLIPHNRGKTLEQVLGKQRAQEIKEYNRQNMKKENMKRWGMGIYKNAAMGAGISGKRKDVGFKRSTWEANLARIFLYQNRKFQYEPKIFILKRAKGDKILFIPDFKIKNEWWEVKGWLDKRSLEKIELFLEQHTNKKLVIVCRPQHIIKNNFLFERCKYIDYFRLEKQFKHLIPNWETERVNFKTHPKLFK